MVGAWGRGGGRCLGACCDWWGPGRCWAVTHKHRPAYWGSRKEKGALLAVRVSFAGQEKAGKAGADGYWKVMLDPMPASREAGSLGVQIGDAVITRGNILVGEVWLAAGHKKTQSQQR